VISAVEPLSIFERNRHLALQARFLELCTNLDAMGGGTIVVYPGPRTDMQMTEQRGTEGLARALRDLGAIAAPFDVTVAFEPRSSAHGAGGMVPTASRTLHRTGAHNVKLALDTLEFHRAGGRSQDLSELRPSELALVRLSDADGHAEDPRQLGAPTLAGQGAVPVRTICRQLGNQGFRGPYSAELPSDRSPTEGDVHRVWQAALDVLGQHSSAPTGQTALHCRT
jgi:sugar phosphate isomerase/epimerase